jgi:hypothetical protein
MSSLSPDLQKTRNAIIIAYQERDRELFIDNLTLMLITLQQLRHEVASLRGENDQATKRLDATAPNLTIAVENTIAHQQRLIRESRERERQLLEQIDTLLRNN